MEEDIGSKAPVTRLRRRLSVEQSDDTKSLTPNTPTKKRGKLAAKPELNLIDENSVDNTPKKAAKTIPKNMADANEKPVTPSRRSTRIKSNTSITSIVSETTQGIDSPRAKRAARRTSQVGSDNETVVTPAKQTRRTRKDSASSVEKENVPITKPVMQITEVILEEQETKSRKSKDNSLSLDKSDEPTRRSPRLLGKKNNESKTNQDKPEITITKISEMSEIVADQKETDLSFNDNNETDKIPQSKEKEQLSLSNANLLNDLDVEPKKRFTHLNKTMSALQNLSISESKRQRTKSWTTLSTSSLHDNNFYSDNEETKKKKNKIVLSNTSSNITDTGDKSDISLEKTKKDANDYSIHKTTENERKSRISISKLGNLSESGSRSPKSHNDAFDKVKSEVSSLTRKKHTSDESNLEDSKSKRKGKTSFSDCENVSKSDYESPKSKNDSSNIRSNFVEAKDKDSSAKNNKDTHDKSIHIEIDIKQTSRTSSTDTDLLPISGNISPKVKHDLTDTYAQNNSGETKDVISANPLFSKDPTDIHTMVFIDDSDSNSEKPNNARKKQENEDQCVPIVHHDCDIQENSVQKQLDLESEIVSSSDRDVSSNSINKKIHNESCEPMDVDETIPDNYISATQSKTDISQRKSTSYIFDEKNDIVDESNKSKRKSSITNFMAQHFERSGNENKSTLILSELKDVSTASSETINSKSPQILHSKILSKSVNILDITQDNDVDKKNISLNCLTSTPLLEKKAAKNIITKPFEKEEVKNTSLKNKSIKSQSTKSEESSENVTEEDESDDNDGDLSRDKNEFLSDEAEEASDDYESGDSRDEEERKYEKENEILEKGETLTSDDELSDDSDYEKDSFVVSSDEEDYDLLDGSSDDLSMSDNELKMTEKSKKKYDERKRKEQKKVSKEMYESRHKLNLSNKSSASETEKPTKKRRNRQRLNSSNLNSSEDEDIVVKPKKNYRIRLDSTVETSAIKSDGEELSSAKKKKNRESKSSLDNNNIEKETEISITEEINTEAKDLLSTTHVANESNLHKSVNTSIKFIDANDDKMNVRDNNISLSKTGATDPLQATIINGDDESDSPLSSDGENILQNYESVLNEINKNMKTNKSKQCNISLNLDSKTKSNNKVAIVDQLNLTQTKTTKKSKKKQSDEVDNSEFKNKPKKDTQVNNKSVTKYNDDGSSDSIDLHLLFSEDSNNSDNIKSKNNQNTEEFIPLKRTEGKTKLNIGDDSPPVEISYKKHKSDMKEKSLNESQLELQNTNTGTDGAKKSKRKSSIITPSEEQIENYQNEVENNKQQNSSKKNKKKSLNITTEEQASIADDIESSKQQNSSKKNKKKSLNISYQEHASIGDEMESGIQQNSSKKHKKKSMYVSGEEQASLTDEMETNNQQNSSKKHKNKSLNISCEEQASIADDVNISNQQNKSKKRKRKSSTISSEEQGLVGGEGNSNVNTSLQVNECVINSGVTKKRKISTEKENETKVALSIDGSDILETASNKVGTEINKINSSEHLQEVTGITKKKANKKRKEREDDDGITKSKVFKGTAFDQVHINRLPSSILNQLEDKPKVSKADNDKKIKVVSTSDFLVEETRKRKNKPSNYLEESICLNDDDTPGPKKQRDHLKKPKVLPFIPTASTSDSGYTTNFKINVIPREVKFVAQSSNVANFKNDYLYSKKIKRLGTYELYKRNRNIKMSKF